MQNKCVQIIVFFAALSVFGVASAAGAADGQAVAKITAALKSGDNFQVQQAVEKALDWLNDERNTKNANDEVPNWLKILLSQKRFEEIEQVAMVGMVSQPTNLQFIESCQMYRVRASLVSGKPKEALQLAKGLYNVCAMSNTAHSIDLVAECLYELNQDKDPAAAVKKYKLEQFNGASPPAKGAPDGVDKGMLADVHVDAQQYDKAIAACELNADGFVGLIGKGNFLLLADRPKEAHKVFDKAYALSSDKNLAVASEAVARSMRAEDGTVGRANEWILSLRPTESGQ
jgi:tetratricopeptide (TPR) repeat protein